MPDHEFRGVIPSKVSKAYEDEETAEKAFQELYEGLEGDYDLKSLGSMDAIYRDGNKSPVATREGDTLDLLDEEAEETLRDLGYELEVEK